MWIIGGREAALFAQGRPDTAIDNVWSFEFCLYREHGTPTRTVDLHFCAPGYLFIIISIMSLVLLGVSLYALARLNAACKGTNTHRKVLFALLAAVGFVRAVYAILATVRISTITDVRSAAPVMRFMVDTLIPVNALSDLLTAAVDFLLTFFWLSVLGSKLTQRTGAQILPVLAMLVFTVFGFVCFAIDRRTLRRDQTTSNIYALTLCYIATLLFFSALLHFITVVMLLLRLHGMNQQQELSPSLRRHFFRVSIIGVVSTCCWLFRGMVLIGRAAEVAAFTSGTLSFGNGDFTMVYFVLFMNFPCVIVALSFLELSLELFRRQESPGATSVVVVGDEERGRRYFRDGRPGTVSHEASPLLVRQSQRIVHHTLSVSAHSMKPTPPPVTSSEPLDGAPSGTVRSLNASVTSNS